MSGAASRDKRRARAGGQHARFADSWCASSGLVRLYSTVVLSLSVLGGIVRLVSWGWRAVRGFYGRHYSRETMFRYNIQTCSL